MNQVMLQKWHGLLSAWAVDPLQADQTFAAICQRYAEPGRHYHTLEHIQSMLEVVDKLSPQARNPNSVRLAAWLHDVIYDSKASDNEERSAELVEKLCGKLSIPEGRSVAALILKTKTHEPGDDPDAQVLIDADLAILGAKEPVYRSYADKIRLEYGWVPEPEYRSGRRRILEGFLARPRIYHFLSHLDGRARDNIAAEIALLAPLATPESKD